MYIPPKSLDTICASLAYAMGINPPEFAAGSNDLLVQYIDEKLGGEKADRILMYNPDAIGKWVWQKYASYMDEVEKNSELDVDFQSPLPAVTPVCFGTMYTGAQPAVHGIRTYAKPVIKIDSLFDAMIRAGKRCAIVADSECSMGRVFLEREMDYFIYDTLPEVNAKACELILEDKYDLICVYNGNYDSVMHKTGTESVEALSEMRANSFAFANFYELIKNNWSHNTLIGFAMDHGCHDIDGSCGSHGLDMDEDLHISHRYGALLR